MKFLISAAGTGGHVFPALEFSQECKNQEHQIIWVGTKSGIENKLVSEHNVEFITLPMSGFRGKGFFKKTQSIIGLHFSIIKALTFIVRHKINYVVCFGGYISLPVGIAAILCRKPLILHEQNAVMGTSNKLLARFAKIIFLGFPLNESKGKNIEIVGNPIRNLQTNQDCSPDNLDIIRIYITGGSLGSDFINQNIPKALNSLNIPMEIKHQSGVGKSEGIKSLYSKNISVEVAEFYESPQEIILWSDFVIGRAGALTLSEVTSLQRGCLMIPLPSAIDNHQLCNAQVISKHQMGIIHQESETALSLNEKLQNIVNQKQYLKWKKLESEIDHFQASRRMLSSVLKIK